MMLWYNFGSHLLSLAALLVIVSCGGGEQRRATDSSSTGGSSSSSSSGGSSNNNYSNRRFHKIQHGQCTYTFILPEGDGARGSCREAKAGSPQHNANSLQRDAPPPEPEFPSQKIQQLEHIMENYTQWLQKVRRRTAFGFNVPLAKLYYSPLKQKKKRIMLQGVSAVGLLFDTMFYDRSKQEC